MCRASRVASGGGYGPTGDAGSGQRAEASALTGPSPSIPRRETHLTATAPAIDAKAPFGTWLCCHSIETAVRQLTSSSDLGDPSLTRSKRNSQSPTMVGVAAANDTQHRALPRMCHVPVYVVWGRQTGANLAPIAKKSEEAGCVNGSQSASPQPASKPSGDEKQ